MNERTKNHSDRVMYLPIFGSPYNLKSNQYSNHGVVELLPHFVISNVYMAQQKLVCFFSIADRAQNTKHLLKKMNIQMDTNSVLKQFGIHRHVVHRLLRFSTDFF